MTDINDALRPQSLSAFVGQEMLKARLRPFISEAVETNRPMAHVLFTSQPGCGKTTLAQVIARELGDPFHVVDLSRMSDRQFVRFISQSEGGVILADEIHRAKPSQQENLLTLMEEGYVSRAHGGRVDVPWITIIAATTQPHKIDGAVLARFLLQLEYEPYTDDELTLIVHGMAQALEVELRDEDARALARAAGGIPRAARDLIRGWRALSLDGGASVEKALMLMRREPDGLTDQHLNYLKELDKLDGQTGERNLCNALRCHPSTLASLEYLLRTRDLITLTPAGRVLTAAGTRRLRGDQEQRTYRRQRA